MAAKAAAAVLRVHCEVSVYPWRLFALFREDREEGAAEFARDAQVCHRRCFLDELSRLHWEQPPGEYRMSQSGISAANLVQILDSACLRRIAHCLETPGAFANSGRSTRLALWRQIREEREKRLLTDMLSRLTTYDIDV